MLTCSSCGRLCDETAHYCSFCGVAMTQASNQLSQVDGAQSYVSFSANGEIKVNVSNFLEAKLALKELKIKKKEYSIQKRQITEQERIIRAEYTNKVRQRGSKFQGGGGVGKFIRSVQTVTRDAARRELANKLAPYEQQKRFVESMISAIDQIILKIEAAIQQHS